MDTKFFYSSSENSFYPADLLENYEAAGTLPDDLIGVDEDIFLKFTQTPPEGKIRICGENGQPTWGDVPPPTKEEIMAIAEARKLSLKAQADSEIAWRQDAVDAGIATDEETAALTEWKKYRVLLMRIDTAKPVWPIPPGEQAS